MSHEGIYVNHLAICELNNSTSISDLQIVTNSFTSVWNGLFEKIFHHGQLLHSIATRNRGDRRRKRFWMVEAGIEPTGIEPPRYKRRALYPLHQRHCCR